PGQARAGARDLTAERPWPGMPGIAAARGGLLVGVLTLAFMAATDPGLPIVWDEGFTLIRLARGHARFRAIRDPGSFAGSWNPAEVAPAIPDRFRPPVAYQLDSRAKLFTPSVIAWFWPFAREEPHGHPPFYALLGLIGSVLTPERDELARARLGPILLFAA